MDLSQPMDATIVEPIFAVNLDPVTNERQPPDFLNDTIVHLNINLQKRTPFLFLTDCNIYALAVFNCNNCTRYVENQKVSLLRSVRLETQHGKRKSSG
jgi:hypothetical protein